MPPTVTPAAGIPAAYRPQSSSAPGDAASTDQPVSADEARRQERLHYPSTPEPLPVPVMDNHTHLDFRSGLPLVNVEAALDAAAAVGVCGAVQVGCDLESSRFTVAAVAQEPRLLGAVAIHPNDAPKLADQGGLEAALAEIEDLAGHPRIRAIGETGLDYYRTPPEGIANQQYSFRRHLDIAKRLDLALQIHDRDAHEDVVATLHSEGAPDRVVFHCFSGDAALARVCNENGWYMSFAGTVTFKNADNLREALRLADPALVLTETDAPFLTPHPFRGRPNAPYLVPYTVRSMADVLNADLAGLCQRIADNSRRVYGEWDD